MHEIIIWPNTGVDRRAFQLKDPTIAIKTMGDINTKRPYSRARCEVPGLSSGLFRINAICSIVVRGIIRI